MGFPESESRAALTAAFGNPDLAYEYLLTGIPLQRPAVQAAAPSPAAGSSSLQQFRTHPQFEMLKQLIQSNPSSLPQVLNLIGQQNPALLQAIHANEQEFLAMMNEPAGASPAPALHAPAAAPAGQPNTAQLIQALSSLPPQQAAQFAQSLGISQEQLGAVMQMMSQMPPEQLEQLMAAEGAGGAGQAQGGPNSIAITNEELESVNRLMALGFSQQQALQAFIACDRNETLAANFLFESGGFDDDGGDFEEGDDHAQG